MASAVIVRKLRYLSENTGFRHFSSSCSSSQTRERTIEIWNGVGVGLPCIPERAWLPPYTGRNSVRKLKVSDIMLLTLHHQYVLKSKQVDRLKEKIATATKQNGVAVSEKMYKDLCDILKTDCKKLMEKQPPDSFQHIFWKQQMEAVSKHDARGIC